MGTLVRIFSCGDGSKLRELRRGTDTARIYSVCFSRGDAPDWLAVTSDKRTVHIFNLRPREREGGSQNPPHDARKVQQKSLSVSVMSSLPVPVAPCISSSCACAQH